MRQSVEFTSRHQCCRGWLFRPDAAGDAPRPGVVMAHGFSAVKEMHLVPFAERIVAEGIAVLVFDFRHLGESEGEPRGHVIPMEQQEDYRNAITWLARQPGIDPRRIGAWGTSYSGGHVLQLGAFDRRLRAIVAQVPAVNMWRQILHDGGRTALDALLGELAAARAQRVAGEVQYLAVVGKEGDPAVLPQADALEWFERTCDRQAPRWRNQVTLESVEQLAAYAPADAIELVSPTPLLMILAERDSIIPLEVSRSAFERAGEPKQLLVLSCQHFWVYDREPWRTRAAEAAATFFRIHLGAA